MSTISEWVFHNPVPVLLAISGISFLLMLGGNSLWDVDEPNNAVCAREMLEAGNWLVPVFNGALRFDKPILLYWLMMPSFSIFGINEFSARLPSAMAMTGLTMVIWYFGRRLLDARSGLIAAALFATCLHIVVIGRAATPDPLLMLSLGFALPALFCVYIEGKSGLLLPAAYVAIALGILAKGPVALAMPVLVMGSFLFLMRDFSAWPRFRPWLGLAIIVALAVPWYIAVGVLTDGEWLKVFFLHHNIERFTDTLQGHRAIPGMYILTVLAGWFPWTGLVAAAVYIGPWRLSRLREKPMRLFLLSWLGSFLLFFTVARTHLPNYMLPIFPAVALLVAGWLKETDAVSKVRAWRWLAGGGLMLAVVVMIGGGIALNRQWPGEWIIALALLPAACGALWPLWRRQASPIQSVATGMVVSVILLAAWAAPTFDRHKISQELAHQASDDGFSGTELATYRYFQPSLLFYHGGRLPRLGTASKVVEWLQAGKAVVLPENVLKDLPNSTREHVVVHNSVKGLYARTRLLLISLSAGEET